MTAQNLPRSDDDALPIFPMDSFVGRRSEKEYLHQLLGDERGEIVTVTGPGGVGKSRLSLEVLRDADAWSDLPIAVIPLAAAQQDGDLVRSIAQGLNIVDHEEHLRARIEASLRERPHLILLDNLEQAIEGARSVVGWLASVSPRAQFLATSRIALGLPEERILELGPLQTLPVPDHEDGSLQLESVQLFLDRARVSNPRFRLHEGDLQRISDLCRRYDGLPLAIELVASWSNVLTPREMLERDVMLLEDRNAGRDDRHHGIENAIRWSYNLLSDAEQAVFRRLSLFPGGFSRDLADGMIRGTSPESILPRADGYDLPWRTGESPDIERLRNPYEEHAPSLRFHLPPLDIDSSRTIANLLDHHLILPAEDVDGVLCFDMFETLREFGMNELRRLGEYEGARQAHAVTMLAFAEASSNFLWSVSEPRWGVERVMTAMPSLRAALHWLDTQGEAGQEIIARIAGPLWIVYQTRGLITEGRQWLESAMLLPERLDWLRGIELPPLAFLCWIQNDDSRAVEVTDAALGAMSRSGITSAKGLVHLVRALVLYRQPEPDFFAILAEVDEAEASFLAWNVTHGLVGCRTIYGIASRLLGNTEQALDLFEEAHRIAVEMNYGWGAAITRYFTGETLREIAEEDESRLPEACAMITQALSSTWEQGDAWSSGGALSGLACINFHQGELIEAATMFGAASTLMQRVGASLLPADFLTHADTSERLRERIGHENYDTHFAAGAKQPENVVERILNAFSESAQAEGRSTAMRLTNRQMAVVHDLAMGYDPPAIARRRGRSVSATYELVERIAARLGVDTWEEIIPAAVSHGLLGRPV